MGLCEESLQQLPLNMLVRWDSVEKSLQQHNLIFLQVYTDAARG
jgi:hypothetical protein